MTTYSKPPRVTLIGDGSEVIPGATLISDKGEAYAFLSAFGGAIMVVRVGRHGAYIGNVRRADPAEFHCAIRSATRAAVVTS